MELPRNVCYFTVGLAGVFRTHTPLWKPSRCQQMITLQLVCRFLQKRWSAVPLLESFWMRHGDNNFQTAHPSETVPWNVTNTLTFSTHCGQLQQRKDRAKDPAEVLLANTLQRQDRLLQEFQDMPNDHTPWRWSSTSCSLASYRGTIFKG